MKIKIPIYGGTFIVEISNNLQDCFNKYNINVSSLDYNAISLKRNINGKREYLIFLKNDSNEGIIAHECKHVVNYIFKDIGQQLDLDNDEAECYLLKWLVNTTIKIKNDKTLHSSH